MTGTASFADFVELVGKLAWPVVVAGLLAWLLFSKAGRELVKGLAKRISAIKGPGGLEIKLTSENAEKVKVDLEAQFAEYRSEIRRQFDALNYQHDVVRLRDEVVEKVLYPSRTKDGPVPDLRCMIYVPDIVFADALYGLTDYYPTGDGAGAVYSIRFGIIGRQWRLRESFYDPEVTVDKGELMEKWGMTRAQANVKSKDRSFLVVMLRHNDVEQGLLFASSDRDNAFADSSIATQVEAHQCTRALARQVAHVNSGMRGRGPALRLFEV